MPHALRSVLSTLRCSLSALCPVLCAVLSPPYALCPLPFDLRMLQQPLVVGDENDTAAAAVDRQIQFARSTEGFADPFVGVARR